MEDLLRFKVEQIFNRYILNNTNKNENISLKDVLNEFDKYISIIIRRK